MPLNTARRHVARDKPVVVRPLLSLSAWLIRNIVCVVTRLGNAKIARDIPRKSILIEINPIDYIRQNCYKEALGRFQRGCGGGKISSTELQSKIQQKEETTLYD